MKNLKTILKQKKWNGADLGRIRIADILISYKKSIQAGEPIEGHIFKINEIKFSKELESLSLEEKQTYYNYVNMGNWVTRALQLTMAQEQQAIVQSLILDSAIKRIIDNEEIQQILDSTDEISADKADKIRKSFYDSSLESFYDEEKAANIKEAREIYIASIYFVIAFDKVLDMIMELFGVEEIYLIKRNFSYFDEFVELFKSDYEKVIKSLDNYKDEKAKESKLYIAKKLFYPLELEKTYLSKERIETTRNYIETFEAFNNYMHDPVNTLCRYIPTNE